MKIYKVVIGETASLAKEEWLIPATSLQHAVNKARATRPRRERENDERYLQGHDHQNIRWEARIYADHFIGPIQHEHRTHRQVRG